MQQISKYVEKLQKSRGRCRCDCRRKTTTGNVVPEFVSGTYTCIRLWASNVNTLMTSCNPMRERERVTIVVNNMHAKSTCNNSVIVFLVRFKGRHLANRFGPGTGRIWLDNLYCTGTESFIGDCRHNGWGVHNCVHREDISIACYRNLLTNG